MDTELVAMVSSLRPIEVWITSPACVSALKNFSSPLVSPDIDYDEPENSLGTDQRPSMARERRRFHSGTIATFRRSARPRRADALREDFLDGRARNGLRSTRASVTS